MTNGLEARGRGPSLQHGSWSVESKGVGGCEAGGRGAALRWTE